MTQKKEQKKATGFRSLTYRSGFTYNWMTKRLYDQKKKFLSIGALIGRNKTVLDLPCGTGYLTHFVDPSIEYIGYDLNHTFLKKLKVDFKRGKVKPKKLTVKQQDIFDYSDYPKKVDVIVFCDILHHIVGRHVELVENAKNFADKIIICEPVAIRPQDMTARDKFFNLVLKISRSFPEGLLKIVDFLFLDNDGINSYEQRASWQQGGDSLKDLYYGFGIKDKDIYKVSDDFIGVWKR